MEACSDDLFAFQCGHTACGTCVRRMSRFGRNDCPECRVPITEKPRRVYVHVLSNQSEASENRALSEALDLMVQRSVHNASLRDDIYRAALHGTSDAVLGAIFEKANRGPGGARRSMEALRAALVRAVKNGQLQAVERLIRLGPAMINFAVQMACHHKQGHICAALFDQVADVRVKLIAASHQGRLEECKLLLETCIRHGDHCAIGTAFNFASSEGRGAVCEFFLARLANETDLVATLTDLDPALVMATISRHRGAA